VVFCPSLLGSFWGCVFENGWALEDLEYSEFTHM
jgi:hypothetical protein